MKRTLLALLALCSLALPSTPHQARTWYGAYIPKGYVGALMVVCRGGEHALYIPRDCRIHAHEVFLMDVVTGDGAVTMLCGVSCIQPEQPLTIPGEMGFGWNWSDVGEDERDTP